jgi:uncharacterized damage-inducible protein DinB
LAAFERIPSPTYDDLAVSAKPHRIKRDALRNVIDSIEAEYRRYRKLAEDAFAQLSEEELAHAASGSDNAVAAVAWHIAGNLRSRFTDFLTSDGEKPWRDRESEFDARRPSRQELLAFWDQGWSVLSGALAPLTDADLSRLVTIRGQQLPVLEALHRSLAHTAYHVGQIVYIAKAMRGEGWKSLSIPRGKSDEYNRNPTSETPPR